MTDQRKYRGRVVSEGGFIEVDVLYRIRPWGVDLDEVFIADTPNKIPLTAFEYYRLTKDIGASLHREKPC